MKLGRYVI